METLGRDPASGFAPGKDIQIVKMKLINLISSVIVVVCFEFWQRSRSRLNRTIRRLWGMSSL